MQAACPRCQAVLDYADHPPAFCSRCGRALTPSPVEPTEAFEPAATGLEPPLTAETSHSIVRTGDVRLPEIMGGYRLLRVIGSGGMGTVFEAEDIASGRRVALKLIASDYAGSAEAIERFRREGRLASTLAHPRCVFVFAADEEAGRPYIVMELMPGRTLEDLIAEEGPMTPGAAIAHILDVIDGLREAHRLGFIHRDVKPSNCFLDAEGRVKVGDFGLAKSLMRSDNLTRTGSFLGTVLFAAPEQIKGEALDPQTDVYAVAATLYYLLTARAPFAGGDAAATLARTVSEPAPSMRTVRPELDPALDAVVRRGLERERGRRWRSLTEFKAALLPFLPGPLPVASLGIRFAAYLLDGLFLLLVSTLLMILLGELGVPASLTPPKDAAQPEAEHWQGLGMNLGRPDAEWWLGIAFSFLYYALLEGRWGASLGKRLLRMRVRRASARSRPGLARILLRTVLCEGLLNLDGLAWTIRVLVLTSPGTSLAEWARTAPLTYTLAALLPLLGLIVGTVVLLAPMRARNGYRGLHEWLSDTRTVRLPRPEKRRVLAGQPREWPLSHPEGMPPALGPFVVRGAICWEESAKVLLGQDRGLGRSVWIWLRPATDAPLSVARRDISRPARLRWLACGRHADGQWDAFMAFNGSPLPRPSPRREERWPQALPLLEQLTDELTAASTDETLPDTLYPDQVWVGPDGQLQLVDIPLRATDAEGACGPDRARTLLADVAVLVLEGQPRAARQSGPARAPVPLHSRPLLDRLLGVGKPHRNLDKWRAQLKALADQPAEISASRRATHLAVQTAFLFLGLGCCMLPAVSANRTTVLKTLRVSIQDKEHWLRDLEEGATLEFSTRIVNPDPLVRLHAAVQLESDYRLGEHLRQALDREQRQYAARQEVRGGLSRRMLEQFENQSTAEWDRREKERMRREPALFGPGQFRRRARVALEEDPHSFEETEGVLTGFWFAGLVTWPALWVIWAFLARGGLSYRLTGIALVRGDGRPAPRWRCAWRAFLVWAPLTALLALSFWLEEHYWSLWQPDASPRWLLSLSSAVWYAALLLLASYVLLALWRPARTLHDRLSGVYLVPR